MNIGGISVCVNYSDLLAKSLDRWSDGLSGRAGLTIVTTKSDVKTRQLCEELGVDTHLTDVFYANGAKFNKGAALSEAIKKRSLLNRMEWLLTFDADICPPHNWRALLEEAKPEPGTLYGAHRWQVSETFKPPLTFNPWIDLRMPQSWVLGFFMLFHADDPRIVNEHGHVFDTWWPHCGNYDTVFARRWPKDQQHILTNIPMIHFGEERKHWTGRGKQDELMNEFLAKRNGYSDWERERMSNPPTI